MKNLINLIFCTCAILLVLNSCIEYNKVDNLNNCEKNQLIVTSKDDSYLRIDVYKIKYEGHEYILFGKYKGVSVVHNPNCKYCKKDTINN